MRFFIIPLLLAAATSAEVFHFAGQQGQSSVYGVRGAVTVGVEKLTGEKTALEYNGTLALEQVREGEYLAKFTQFTLGKYDKINRNIRDETLGNLKPEEQRLAKTLREQGQYEQQMQKPVKFFMKEGKVVRIEAEKEHQQWSLNIFRGIFTLLQNQVRKPTSLAVPAIEYKYEDGITGNCKVQYEILSQPDEFYGHATEVYNMTKTVDYKDCLARPVYRHLKDVPRGCAGVCDNHKPENFLAKYDEEKTDYELKPTPGCPANQQRQDSLVTVNSIAKYNVSGGRLEEARAQSTDVYHLFGGETEVFTRLQLRLRNTQGPKIQEPQNVQTYTTLQQRLPAQAEKELDIPVYALMREHNQHQKYPENFGKHFDAIIGELQQIQHQQNQQGQKYGHEQKAYNTPAYMVELLQAVSGMTEEELRQTIPGALRHQQTKQLSEEEQLRRQLWIELIGKAGSKTAVKLAVEFIKNKTFTPSEARRVLQDIAGFQSYPDTDMIEQVLGLCTMNEGLTPTGKATACVAAGKIISKGCDSQVYQRAQKEQRQRKRSDATQRSEQEPENEEYEESTGHPAIKPQLRCTPEKLQQYVERLSQALRQSTDFKQVVAYINGLSKIQKPEVLRHLIGYVNGTAHNMHQLRDQGEQQNESAEFVRRVAIISLRDVATKYPKEINPIVRVIYQNTTENVQTRILAFDVWMNTQPAQWEVEKVMQVANKDTSAELTHYVYTALKTAMHAEEPCYQLLAQRIRAAWTQIRPFDSGMKYSQFRSKSIYNPIEDFGFRGISKVITSNTTFFPTYTQAKLEQIRGPYMKTLFGAKFLVKGGDKIWDELTGKDGLLERIAHAINGQVKTGERLQQTEQLLKDIAQGMDIKNFDKETPKAVLFWKLFSGEVVIPIDAEYVKELKQELLQTVTKVGKEGLTGHYFRVYVPTKAFHVEPTTVGLPVVHSTIHPIVMSVRYANVKLNYKNQQGRLLPETFELTGSIKPTVLSYRQISRLRHRESPESSNPTFKTTDIKEFNLGLSFKIAFEHGQRRLTVNFKPHFERVLHSGHCTELKLQKNTIVDEKPRTNVMSYDNCIKSLYEPIRHEKQIGGRWSGMVLRLTGESHQPWSGLPLFGSKDAHRNGVIGALLNRLANKGMKHHAMSLYLETDKQQPMNEWSAVIDMDSNIEALAKTPLDQQAQKAQKVKVQYQPRRQEQLDSELRSVLEKVETLLQKLSGKIQETTLEKQLLVKLEGRYQGQPKNTIKIAMKKVYNLEKTQQKFALAAESQESRKGIELFANVSWPKMPTPFHFDPTHNAADERMNGTLYAKLQGQQEQTYRVKFQATKSEEQRKGSELKHFEIRCLAEQKSGYAMSDSCEKAILKDNSLDRMEMTVELPENVHPKMRQLAKQTLTAVKYAMYPNMQSDISGRQQQQQQQRGDKQQIYISANTTRESQWSLLHNIRIEMPRENVTFSNIRIPGFRPAHVQLTLKQQLEHVATRGGSEPRCIVASTGVRTFDKVPFHLTVKDGCEYLLTRDQTQGSSDFIVTFKVKNEQTHAKQVRIQLRNSIIELEPFVSSDNQFMIGFNNTKHVMTIGKVLVFSYGGNDRVFIGAKETSTYNSLPIVYVYTESKNFEVVFDGTTIGTKIGAKYHGHVNGICGNYDNEKTHEFVGPNGHEYQHANEFIASYGVGQDCKVPKEDIKEKMMEKLQHELKQIRQQEKQKKDQKREHMTQETHYRKQPQYWQEEMKEFFHENQRMDYDEPTGQDDQSNHQVLRTYVSSQQDLFCFSVERVPTCKPGYHKEGVLRTEQVDSVCLKKGDSAAQHALQKIRKHENVNVSELEHKSVKHTTVTVSIPKCVRR
ncbi:vitellogenin-6 [Galendromus occidentalis]|uniref:Vitellogenin-6 n=1 Tax=Galendromus occidentalis TaxID=34638 RepID=A0AAJ6QWV9_9ACAR|nr:vitellogenin-6 [Galendromus occidentalis]